MFCSLNLVFTIYVFFATASYIRVLTYYEASLDNETPAYIHAMRVIKHSPFIYPLIIFDFFGFFFAAILFYSNFLLSLRAHSTYETIKNIWKSSLTNPFDKLNYL